jgi:N-glycosylase/DNA lyase
MENKYQRKINKMEFKKLFLELSLISYRLSEENETMKAYAIYFKDFATKLNDNI